MYAELAFPHILHWMGEIIVGYPGQPYMQWRVSLEERGRGILDGRQKREGSVAEKQRLEWCGHSPGMPAVNRGWKRKGQSLP